MDNEEWGEIISEEDRTIKINKNKNKTNKNKNKNKNKKI